MSFKTHCSQSLWGIVLQANEILMTKIQSVTLCFWILIPTFNATSVPLIKGQQVNVSQCSESNTADPWAKWVWTAQVLLKVAFAVLRYCSSTQLVESADAEPQIQKSNKKVTLGYLCRSAHTLFKSVVERAQDFEVKLIRIQSLTPILWLLVSHFTSLSSGFFLYRGRRILSGTYPKKIWVLSSNMCTEDTWKVLVLFFSPTSYCRDKQ